jgi:ATP-dependent Clp protease ATP-binding subunit ClpA
MDIDASTPPLAAALRVARRLGHATLREQHVLLGALEPPSDALSRALQGAGVEVAELRAALEASVSDTPSELTSVTPSLAPELRAALESLELGAELSPAVLSRWIV